MKSLKKIRYGLATLIFAFFIMFGIKNNVLANEFSVDGKTVTYTVTEAKKEQANFGTTQTTGPLYVEVENGGETCTSYRFIVKNESDKVIQVGMYAQLLNEINQKNMRFDVTFGPIMSALPLNSNSFTTLFTGTKLKPGESVWVENYMFKGDNPGYAGRFRIAVAAVITPTNDLVYENVVTKKPSISVTKLSSNKVGIKVTLNNPRAQVSRVSKVEVYKGTKKIKTIQSIKGQSSFLFTYKKKGAGSAKYKVKLTAIANSKDTKTSSKVSPKSNVWKQKVSTKKSAYPANKIGYKIKSISYKGNRLVVKGYAYNTFDVSLKHTV